MFAYWFLFLGIFPLTALFAAGRFVVPAFVPVFELAAPPFFPLVWMLLPAAPPFAALAGFLVAGALAVAIA
jgi:hypothetical protein